MRILLLTTHLNIGGVGVYTVNLAKYLKRNGIYCAVASSGGELVRILTSENIPHFALNIKTKSEFGLRMWKTLPCVVRLVKDNAFDLIHAQTRVAQVLAYLTKKFTRVPFVSTCHGFFRYQRLFRKLIPCWGDRVIAISESVREHLIKDFCVPGHLIEQIYNGIELDKYISQALADKDYGLMSELGLPRNACVIGAIGRLSQVKGFKYLVTAFKDIAVKNPNVRLLIVGDGPEKKSLERQFHKLGISGKAVLTPGCGSLERYFSIMDIFCLPSIHEGLGMSLMEAMASGRACVAAKTGGIQELITHEQNGLLAPAKSSKALYEAIRRLLNDEAFRRELSENAKNKALKHFSIQDSVRQTIEVYEKVRIQKPVNRNQ